MENLTFSQIMEHQETTCQEAIEWHKINNDNQIEKVKPAYQAGHHQGFMDAFKLLKKHYKIQIKN